MRPKLTYANVVSTLCLFIVLGGGAYAASKINGKTIKPKSLPGNRIVPNTVTGTQVKESSLKIVPVAKKAETANTAEAAFNANTANTAGTAQNADKIDGRDATCANDTTLFLGRCWETATRGNSTAFSAATTCTSLGATLPGPFELVAFSKQVTLAAGGEWTDDFNKAEGEESKDLVVTVSPAGVVNSSAANDATKGYRCVFPLVR